MSKIKVLRIVTRLSVGGVPLHCSNLAKLLDKDKYEHLLVHGSLGESEGDMRYLIDDEPNVFIPELIRELSIKQDIRAFFKIVKLIRKYKPDIVHTHHAKAGMLGRAAAKMCGVPVIIHTFHGNVFQGYFSPLKSKLFINIERFLALISSKIIAISKIQKEELLQFKIAPAKKIEIVKLGFNFANVRPEADFTSDFRERYNLAKDDILVGSIGRVVPIKNQKMLVDIAEKVIKSTKRSVKFVIVGDGEERENIANYVAEKHVQAYFVFTGFTRNLKEIYHEMDIVALTSLNEGTPVAIIEAMANRKIVFSTNVGGIADFIEDNKSGFYFDVNDTQAYSQKLSEIINVFDSKELDNIREKAHEVALSNFSVQRLIADIDHLYSKLLTKKRR